MAAGTHDDNVPRQACPPAECAADNTYGATVKSLHCEKSDQRGARLSLKSEPYLILIHRSWKAGEPFPQLCSGCLLTCSLLSQTDDATRGGSWVIEAQLISERRAHGGRARPRPSTCAHHLHIASAAAGGWENLVEGWILTQACACAAQVASETSAERAHATCRIHD